MAVRDFKKFLKRRDKNQRAFIEGSWSDSGEEDDEKVNNETCVVAQASSEVYSASSYFSDENSSIDDLVLDNEYDKITHGLSSRQTSSYYVTHPTSVVDYDDEYQQDDVHNNSEDPLVSVMLLLAKAITQNFSNPTNNRLRASSNTRNQAITQEDRVNIQSRNSGNTGRNNRRAYVQEEVVEGMNAQNETRNVQRTLRTSSLGNTSTVQCYNCSGKAHYARNCPKPRNDFLFADALRMEEIKELSANICLMARIQPSDHTSDDGSSYESVFISEVQSSSIDENNEPMYPTHTKIINSTTGDDQINSNIKFDSFKGNVNSGSVDKDTHVPDLCVVEKLARNAYQKAKKQRIFAKQMEKLEDENVSLDFIVVKPIINGAIRAENQNLLTTISELKKRLEKAEKGKSVNTKFDKTNGFQSLLCVTPLNKQAFKKKSDVPKTEETNVVSKPVTLQTSPTKQTRANQNTNVIRPGMYRVVTTQESQTSKTKSALSSTGMNATSRVRRPMSRDSHVAHSVLDNSKKEKKNVAVYVRKNKQEDVIPNKENVIDVDVANASKAKTLLCVSCMKNVLIPCHDKCVAKHKLNVRSNIRRTFSTNSRSPKSSETTFVAPKTRFSEKKTQSKTLDTTFVVSKSKIDVESASKAKDKVSSASRIKQRNLRQKPLNTFIKNKIRTSRIWQKWFESQPNVIWTPVSAKPNVHNTRSFEKPSVSVKKWVVKLPSSPCAVSSCVAGTVRFGNDNFAAITGYGDYIHGNITICHVYYVEGLGHNLFSVGQFCDGDLEVAFRSNTCYVQNLEGDDLLTGGRDSNLYTISISDMAVSSPVCLMSKETSTKSWLWHRRLSQLNFGTVNDLTRLNLVNGLPKFKNGKDHLCSAYERGKSKKTSHPPKLVPSDHSKLELLHMDLCGPMRVASINGKRHILIIKKFIAQAQLNYKAKVYKIRTDNGTEFKNITLKADYEKLGIMQQFPIAHTPQQNGVVERRNRTLVEAARTMLIFSRLPEFLWAEAVATTCFTQNRSIIHTRYNKTPYELLRGQKPNIAYFHVFGSLCYPTNDRDDLGKMKPKADIGVFIGYSETSTGFRIYNRRTKMIMETIHVKFDELTAMASEHDCLEPELQRFNNHNSSAEPMNTLSKEDLDNLFGPMFEEYFEKTSSDTTINSAAQPTQVHEDSSSTSSIFVDAHEAPLVVTTSDKQTSPISLTEADEFNQEDSADFDGNAQFVPYNPPSREEIKSSITALEPLNVQNFHQVQPSTHIWTKDHPLDQVIGDPSKPAMTRQRLHTDSEVCMYALTVRTIEPKNIKEAMVDHSWIESMQDELNQFERLQV
ncbi:retrovirus-related pol polyprotein from transposon TNT 1-94 [Tanacetum coccineum]